MTIRGGCWPTHEQAQLLGAILLPEDAGVRAWEQWRQAVDIGRLDAGSARLLPHLYRRLEQYRVRDPLVSALKDLYQRTWYANHRRLLDMTVALERLQDRGIETMLLKGAALVLRYYPSPGLRPMDDVDVLVRPHQATAAVGVLAELGWTSGARVTDDHVLASHAMDFLGPGMRRLDLHWHLLPDSCWTRVDEGLWDRAAVGRVGEIVVRVLDPTDQLLHISAHGPRWEPVSPIRWIADAEAVLARSDGEIDWDRFVEEAARHRVTLPVLDAVSYLRETFGLPVPVQTLERLRQIPVRTSERWAYRLRIRPATRLLGRFPEHWLRYRSLRRGWEAERRIGFVRYLEIVLGCDGAWTLVHRALFRARWRRQSRDLMEEYARQFHPAVPP